MPILRCSVSTCMHNKKDECCLEKIDVSGKDAETAVSTACESFSQKSDTMTNSMGEEMPQPVVNIKCDATKCTHNEKCICAADHIQVNGSKAQTTKETECSTFECGCSR